MTSEKRSRITVLSIVFVFLLTTLFGLGVFAPSKAKAEGSDGMLKFKQIAAGEDFAIALTYDNKLYGWSLKDDLPDSFSLQTQNPNGITLGEYYPKYPIQIPVEFRAEANGVIAGAPDSTDSIKKIAATRTTAAFITEHGYIYTWGLDGADELNYTGTTQELVQKKLLMRTSAAGQTGYTAASLYKPWPVNYKESVDGNRYVKNFDMANGDKAVDISGGGNNYVVKTAQVSPDGSVSNVKYFSWGDSTFYQVTLDSEGYVSSDAKPATIEALAGVQAADELFAGQGFMMRKSGGSMYFKGKNYYLPSGKNYGVTVKSDSSGESVVNTYSATLNSLFNGDESNLVRGENSLNGSIKATEDSQNYTVTVNNAFVTDLVAMDMGSLSVSDSSSAAFLYSDGTESDIKASRPSVSLGNGYGYFISNGAVYFIGNGYNGENATTSYGHTGSFTQISGLGSATQAVAGNTNPGKYVTDDKYPVVAKNVSHAANVATYTSSEDADVVPTVAFKDDYIDKDSSYISAAIVSGEVKAWNKESQGIKDVKISGFTKNGKNEIVLLTAGYGNNLFALSNMGKIYRIIWDSAENKFVGSPIDRFCDGEGKEKQQWAVNNLSVEFQTGFATVNGSDKTKYDVPTVKAGINYSYSKEADADFTVSGANSDRVAANGNFIDSSKNFASDAYRIVIDSDTLKNANGIFASGTNPSSFKDGQITFIQSGFEKPEDVGSVKFYKRKSGTPDSELDFEIVKKFVDFRIIYETAENKNEVYFEITPKMATKDYDIVVKFWIGRFDHSDNRALDKVSAAGNPVNFYDCKSAELKITIANTQAKIDYYDTFGYDPDETAGPDGIQDRAMSRIPMLDANNVNNTYSIAMMNVSKGLEELSKAIAATGNASQSDVYNVLLGAVKASDSGFPAQSRIQEGDLSHTLGEKAAKYYYNDKYRFFASDMDGDRIALETGTLQFEGSKNQNITVATPRLNIALSELGIDKEQLEKIISADANKTEADYSETFTNNYGFYNIAISEEYLSLRYDVVRITATRSTGSVHYNQGDTLSVTSPEYHDASQSGADTFSLYFNEGSSPFADNKVDGYFHVQSSLRVKTGVLEGNDAVYGADGHNVGIYNHVDVTVGALNAKNIEIPISRFFNDVSAESQIVFSCNGKTDSQSYADFAASFDKDRVMEINSFDSKAIVFTPKAAGDMEILLEARRIVNGTTFGNDEAIRIYVRIHTNPAKFNIKQFSENNKEEITMSGSMGPMKMTLDRFFDVEDSSVVKINYVTVTDESVVTSSVTDNGNSVTFIARKSGVVNVSVSAKLYNESKVKSFRLIVEDIAQVETPLTISDSANIYISEMISFLRAANPYSVISGDIILNRDDPNDRKQGFYFQQYIDGNWVDVAVDDLQFVSTAEVRESSTDSYIKLELKSVGSQEVPARTRIVIKFRDDASNTYAVANEIAPANQRVQDVDENGSVNDFILDIQYGQDFPNQGADNYQPSRNPDSNIVTVPLRYITDKLPNSYNYENVEISFVTAQYGYEEYFTIYSTQVAGGGPGIEIIPLYPTKTLEGDYATVNVSIRNKDSGAGYMLSFYVRISGIKIDLDKKEYGDILLISFLCSFALLFIVFMIRMGVYWKRKAQQRRIIRKNQMLIKMRDKMHNKTSAVPKDQIVRTKLKLEDPKYAKMFDEMRKKKEEETGITLGNSSVAKKAQQKSKAAEKAAKAKGKKNKKGKKSIEELKAELEAKKMSFAQMQMNGVPPVDDSGDMGMGMDSMGGEPMFETVEGFADEAIQPDFEPGFIDPEAVTIDDPEADN